MALILGYLYNGYNFLFNEYKDPRVEHLPFLGSPIPIAGLVAFYVYFVQILGPRLMRDRKPFDLSSVITVYNFLQVVANLYLGVHASYYSYYAGQMYLKCTPINYLTTPEMTEVVWITYFYYMLKLIDLTDTMFFVLRKRNNQITFLHVYHHGGMILASYTVSKFVAGSHATLLGILNAFVHVVMYGYYFLTSFRPELKQSIWWKKHITQLQLIQFAVLVVHFLHPIVWTECAYPKALSFIGLSQNLFMLLLFSDFYYKAYVRKNPKTEKKLNGSNTFSNGSNTLSNGFKTMSNVSKTMSNGSNILSNGSNTLSNGFNTKGNLTNDTNFHWK